MNNISKVYYARDTVSNYTDWLSLVDKVNEFKSIHFFKDEDISIEGEVRTNYGEEYSVINITGSRNCTKDEIDQRTKESIKIQEEQNKINKENELKLLQELKNKYPNEVH